jgi:beta-N-acetylhexosaminidase
MPTIKPPFLQYLNSDWVNKQLGQLTLEQKIGQMFQVAAFSNRGAEHVQQIKTLITEYHIGGITFFQGDPQSQASLTNEYQALSKTPLFINIDAEWGLAMRLQGAVQFPYQMALGAVEDNRLIAEMGASLARQCRALGVQSPLAPVADINNNSKNPVISFRSFGENKELVARKAMLLMLALQENNVLAVAKHFPGHGDTDTDSHMALPVLLHSEGRIRSVELYPFQQLIDAGLGAIMTAHLHIPALDDRPNMPATLSKRVISDLLREEMGFRGLIITDAMDMKGITLHYAPGEADKLALMAGNDIITNSVSVSAGIQEVKKAIESGALSEQWLEEKLRRILAMKEWTGLNRWEPIHPEEYQQQSADPEVAELNRKLAAHALTLLRNDGEIIPLKPAKKRAALHIQCISQQLNDPSLEHHLKLIHNSGGISHFSDLLKSECGMEQIFSWNEKDGEEALWMLVEQLREYDEVLLAFHGISVKPKNNFDLPTIGAAALKQLMEQRPVVLSFFGNAYALDKIQDYAAAKAILLCYQENKYMHSAVANVLSGKTEAAGRLPVSINETFKAGAGIVNSMFKF